jgi:LPXTG-motif cell wall-anchored protein
MIDIDFVPPADPKLIPAIKTQRLVTPANGRFVVEGLNAMPQVYILVEIEAPYGYNMLDNPRSEIQIVFTPAGRRVSGNWGVYNPMVVGGNSSMTGTCGNVQILNRRGPTFPSTGGVGRTLFYVIGLTLMAGAAVALIARRRFKNVLDI